ncbi:ThuA domain-containing protein [Frigidibacter sp. ROC022]|uniref:ThuA domain-containing protein n=1 Tax=Frigidibacter sp. ROC022 TaxID=2971796 RepID=UPI00215B5A55|nr:ThuA domain-containing protein [Frigidibacter sp. ROC022]MCR8722870.1 ThuA domain-containing protein [Frigidibacter sp. ROC022]
MKQALIFWGGWDGHDPQPGAGIVAAMLRDEGFVVRVEEGTQVLAETDPAAFDLIVPIVTMSKIETAELAALVAAVESGTGLAGYHGGMGDSFRDAPEYQFMTGGQWVAHPGNVIDYTVEVIRGDDPIMAGLPASFPYHSEQYYLHTDPSNEVLAVTRFNGEHADWIDGVVMPVVWKRRHGKGRVFYSALGHRATEFEVPEMATILRRGMLWAAR